MVFVAHDPIMQFASAGSGLDREATLDMVFHEDLAGLGLVSTTELIAVRGETLCLHEIRSTAANGDVSDRIYLTEINAAVGRRFERARVEQSGGWPCR